MSWSPESDNLCRQGQFREDLDILRQTYFFSGLNLEALKVLAYLSIRQRYKPGDYIFRHNDDDGQALYVIDGSMQLWHESHTPPLLIREYGDGRFIGGLALLGSMRRLFALKAASDSCCLVLTREKFAKALEQYPDIMRIILKAVVNRIRSWEQNLLIDMTGGHAQLREHIGVSLL